MVGEKRYEVIVSDRAKQMLGTHMSFLAKVNKDAARRKREQLIDAMKSLAVMPERHPFFEEEYIPKGKYHKMFVENWYLILYQIKDNRVEVDYILDFRQESSRQ